MQGLRHWQKECVERAINHYNHTPHFMCVATPGAGKSLMAAELAKQLHRLDKIDFVICFAPSRAVAEGLRETFSSHLDQRFDGMIGSIGCSYTYQSIKYLQELLIKLLSDFRVLVVFDEIHHCAGDSLENANAWGEQILRTIQEHAELTLALSGTPWRSDRAPVSLARYVEPEGRIICDYIYGLSSAINEEVCRIPKIVLIDNDYIELKEHKKDSEYFNGFQELLEKTKISYQAIISQENTISHILMLACYKLDEVRMENKNAAGLVVASSIEHANQVAKILRKNFNKEVLVVNHHLDDALSMIKEFKYSNVEWVVSVGMISEGTDIPRLQVCCHLSRIRTELHFRQVLGRVLRKNNDKHKYAWLFSFAEPNISRFSENLKDEIPNHDVIVTDYNTVNKSNKNRFEIFDAENEVNTDFDSYDEENSENSLSDGALFIDDDSYNLILSENYKQRVIDLFS